MLGTEIGREVALVIKRMMMCQRCKHGLGNTRTSMGSRMMKTVDDSGCKFDTVGHGMNAL